MLREAGDDVARDWHVAPRSLPRCRAFLGSISTFSKALVYGSCFLFELVGTASAAELAGRVVAIADGDTLTALVSRKQIKIRLLDIDAPKKKQPFGTRSRQSLADLCHGKDARVVWQDKDRYRRTLGRVYCAGVDANAEQVRRGMAWVFERYAPNDAPNDSPLYAVHAEARAARRALWQDRKPVPLWEWRALRR